MANYIAMSVNLNLNCDFWQAIARMKCRVEELVEITPWGMDLMAERSAAVVLGWLLA